MEKRKRLVRHELRSELSQKIDKFTENELRIQQLVFNGFLPGCALFPYEIRNILNDGVLLGEDGQEPANLDIPPGYKIYGGAAGTIMVNPRAIIGIPLVRDDLAEKKGYLSPKELDAHSLEGFFMFKAPFAKLVYYLNLVYKISSMEHLEWTS